MLSRFSALRMIAACTTVFSLGTAASAQSNAPKWTPHIDLEAKPGSKRDIGEADFFLPMMQNERTLIFGNARLRVADSDNREGNFGIGSRHMLNDTWNIGGYGYFDRRRSTTGNYFSQVTLGAEALGRNWDLRGNAYVPTGDRVRTLGSTGGTGTPTASIVGSTVQITTPGALIFEERALRGFDAEVGWRAPIWTEESDRQLRLYAGGYRFSDGTVTVSGPRVRAELTLHDLRALWQGAQIMLGAEYQDDNARGSQGFLSLRLRIPLGGTNNNPRKLNMQERRMTAPVVRDVDIVTQSRTVTATQGSTETAALTAGGQSLVVLSSTTTADLPGAVTAAGTNSTVVLSGTFNTTAITQLQTGQTLMGAGTLTVRAPSGLTATLNTPGATIVGAVAGNNPAIAMANNSTLTGLSVSNTATGGGVPNPFAVRANGVTGATISNNTLTGFENLVGGTAQALLISGGSSNIAVLNNRLSATGTGIAVGLNVVNSTDIWVVGNTMSASGNSGGNSRAIVINNGSFRAASNDNTIQNGICSVALAGTGSIGLTSGGSCP